MTLQNRTSPEGHRHAETDNEFGLGRLDHFALPTRNIELMERFIREVLGGKPYYYAGFDETDRKMGRAKHIFIRVGDVLMQCAEPADGMAGGKIVKVDRVEWISMPDVNTSANALMAGEVDIYENPAFDLIAMLKADANVTVAVTDRTGNQPYLRMNHLHPPFNNMKARQALLHIVDQPLYGQAVAGDPSLYSVCPAFLMCGSAYGSSAGAVKPDLEQAKKLMIEAGYKGEKVVLLHPTDRKSTRLNSSH